MPSAVSVSAPHVALRGVHKVYAASAVPALQDVAMDVARGEVFGVIGRSGAGKSTLLRLFNRLEVPSSGQVLLDGQDIAQLKAPQLRALRRRVGMIFQNFNLVSVKTVWHNVAMPLRLAGVPAAERDQRVREVLSLVGLEHKHHAYPAQLSGGQKQRVGIARALVNNPEILLCDEATSALDPETTQSILELLREINHRLGLTIILITHEMDVIHSICDRVLVLDHGCVAEQGPVWQVFGAPQHEVTRQMLRHDSNSLPDDIRTRLRSTPTADAPALLSLRFDGRQAREPDLHDVARSLGGASHMLQARVERIQGRSVGEWLLSVALSPSALQAAVHALQHTGASATVLGYLDKRQDLAQAGGH